MKFILLVVTALSIQSCFSQNVQKLEYCGCTDEIETLTPKPDGKYSRHCNGQLIESGTFKDGLKTGEWLSYNSKGKLIRQFNYVNGKLHGKVLALYSDGGRKLEASFSNGLPDSNWCYFTSKGKPWLKGGYEAGKPVGNWAIFDKKGNSSVVEYDYSNNTNVQNGDPAFLKFGSIVQNDNTDQYFILYYPDRMKVEDPNPLGGYYFANDLLVHLLEVPLDYWDTYENYKYKVHVTLTASHIATYSISTIENHMAENVPSLPFIINTNRDAKLKKVNHSELSKTLLDYKISEAISLLPPWINDGETTEEIYLPYVINQITRN